MARNQSATPLYQARELARLVLEDPNALWSLPDDKAIRVQFDDGIVETWMRAAIWSAYTWIYYVYYPETPALKAHHLGDRLIGANTHLDMIGKTMWAAYDAYEAKGQLLEVEDLCKIAYQAINRIYNHFTYNLEAEVRSISILDFIDVIHHPVIKEANDSVEPTPLSISHTHTRIKKVLEDPNELVDNAVARSAKNGLTSMGQIQQCVGPRGYVTEIDHRIFMNSPILTGFTHGLRKLEDLMVESRSAAKALASAEVPLQKTEYFNRRMQLFAATVENLHPGDCGTTNYIEWRVRSGDLRDLDGKYYLTDKGLKRLRSSDRHLIDQVIHMRTLLHCKHPDPQGVCLTCFGDLGLSVPKMTNLGHVSATALCEQASQSVLSTKHLDSSAATDEIELSEYDQQYIRLGSDPNTIKLSDKLEPSRVYLTLNQREAPHLADVMIVEDVNNLTLTFISELTEVQFTVVHRKAEDKVIIPVSLGTRKSSMSHALLEYIKKNGWSLTPTGNYQVDLKDWDNEEVMFVLPPRHTNMLDYIRQIEVFIRASSTNTSGSKALRHSSSLRSLKDFDSPDAALREFYSIVSERLTVNIANLEVLIKASMLRSSEDRDFAIPREGNKVEFGSYNQVIASRSLAAATAFEKHRQLFADPATYLVQQRMNHPLDALLSGPEN